MATAMEGGQKQERWSEVIRGSDSSGSTRYLHVSLGRRQCYVDVASGKKGPSFDNRNAGEKFRHLRVRVIVGWEFRERSWLD